MKPSPDLSLLTRIIVVFLTLGMGFSLTATAQQGQNWDEAGAHPDHINLTWEQDPASSISVTWRTDTSVSQAKAEIAIATPAPKFSRRAKTVDADTEILDASIAEGEQGTVSYHSVTFNELKSDTVYAYRVGDGEVWSEWFQVRTASEEPEPFSFIYLGDAQNNIFSHWSRTIRAAALKAGDARFMIHAGDLVNNAHRGREWGEWHKGGGWIQGMLPSIPAIGNHEYDELREGEDENLLSIYWQPQFTLPTDGVKGLEETNYYVDYQGVRIIALNCYKKLEEQAAWLKKVLANNPNQWTVATFHYPVFSSSEGRDNKKLRETWKPVFDKYQIDLVMQGHDHTYARGQVKASGTVYINTVAGAKMYRLKDNRWKQYDDIEMERSAENTQLFQVIDVSKDTLRYKSYTVTGQLYDAFDLIKKKDSANNLMERKENVIPERTHQNTVPYRVE